jgi:beta-galactosidase
VDGRPSFLFGGEVQYFRVRDEGFDAARTRRIWSERLDRLRDAGCDYVTTYVPWDHHAPGPGRHDWEGARDLAGFLETAAGKGFRLCVKPGPHILAEWPYGFGSWGAIPLWWRRAHEGELVRDRAGRIFRWHPFVPALGPSYNVLPSYASEAFRAATEAWYAEVHARIRHLLGPGGPVVAIQLDNETNLFWSDIYRIDFHPAALARYRARLRERYGTARALSAAYGRRVRSFEEVEPPKKGRGPAAAHDDWIAHQHALVGEWLDACREAWRRLGVNEPDVLFQTNDTHQTFPGRDFVLPNGPVKNRRGCHALDAYPRCVPIPRPRRVLFDRPWEADWATKLIDVYEDLYLGPSRFALGAEVQGGHFALPVLGRWVSPHEVSAESTTQTWLRVIAHGMKAVAIYVLVGGLNLDGSPYDFQAAVRLDGTTHPRYEGLRRVGAFIRRHEAELLEAEAVESRVAVLADARALGAGYGHDGEQRIYGDELRAAFGWLASAGFTPRALDLGLASDADLDACRALVFPTSGRFDEAAARRLEGYVERGGMLVQALRPGPLARSLFPHEEAPAPLLARLLGPGPARFTVGGAGGAVALLAAGDAPRLRSPRDAAALLAVPDEAPHVLGYVRAHGSRGGRAVFLSATPTAPFASADLFSTPPAFLEAHALLARRLLGLAGEARLFATDDPREEVHARRVPSSGALLLFVSSGHEEPGAGVRLRALPALGLEPERTYAVEDLLDAVPGGAPRTLGEATGAELREEGVRVPLAPLGATVLRVRPVRLDPPATMARP